MANSTDRPRTAPPSPSRPFGPAAPAPREQRFARFAAAMAAACAAHAPQLAFYRDAAADELPSALGTRRPVVR